MINFIPWRRQQRHRCQRRFLSYTGLSFGLGILLMGVMASIWVQQTEKMHQRQAQLIADQQALQPQITYVKQLKKSLAEYQQVQQLTVRQQKQQRQYYQTLMWLAEHWPTAAQLTQLKLTMQAYQLQGVADSANALTELIEQLKQLPYVKHVDFIDWQFRKTTQGIFTLQIQLTESEYVSQGG